MNIKELAEQAAKYSAIMALPTGHSGNELFVEKFAELVAAHEREECAKVCESHVRYPSRLHFAEAIRARSKE